MVRLWVNGEDFGTMSERAARLYVQIAIKGEGGSELVMAETVDPGAPLFLPPEQLVARKRAEAVRKVSLEPSDSIA